MRQSLQPAGHTRARTALSGTQVHTRARTALTGTQVLIWTQVHTPRTVHTQTRTGRAGQAAVEIIPRMSQSRSQLKRTMTTT